MSLLTHPAEGLLPEQVSIDTSARHAPLPPADKPPIEESDLAAFLQGRHYHAHQMLGARRCEAGGEAGARFAVWAPNARLVQVLGDFNSWSKDGQAVDLKPLFGVGHGFVPAVKAGMRYDFQFHPQGPRVPRTCPGRFQFHTGSSPQLSRGCAARRFLEGTPEQRRQGIRGRWHGQRRRRPGPVCQVAKPPGFVIIDATPARGAPFRQPAKPRIVLQTARNV